VKWKSTASGKVNSRGRAARYKRTVSCLRTATLLALQSPISSFVRYYLVIGTWVRKGRDTLGDDVGQAPLRTTSCDRFLLLHHLSGSTSMLECAIKPQGPLRKVWSNLQDRLAACECERSQGSLRFRRSQCPTATSINVTLPPFCSLTLTYYHLPDEMSPIRCGNMKIDGAADNIKHGQANTA
jgi:hypothetical protein